MSELSSLIGKVAIITGASSGIGAATARQLIGEGCKVVAAARSTDKLLSLATDLGPNCSPFAMDLTKPGDIQRLVDHSVARFGTIDVLFANAGIYIKGELHEGEPDAWANLIDVNVTSVFRCVHAVLPMMRANRSGDIVVCSSISGHVDIAWEPIYSASKHAVQSFVNTSRRQLSGDGIRVMSVCPGMVANELWGITDETEVQRWVNEHKSVRSEDVADAVIYMLRRGRHITIRELVMVPQAQDL